MCATLYLLLTKSIAVGRDGISITVVRDGMSSAVGLNGRSMQNAMLLVTAAPLPTFGQYLGAKYLGAKYRVGNITLHPS